MIVETLFAGIDEVFKETLTGINDIKNCVSACYRDGLMDTLNSMQDKLEMCEKALADFLEAKRRIFPRFYFVSTTMLLDILSNGNNPEIVDNYVGALFDGMKNL